MKLFKKDERVMRTAVMTKALKECGFKVREVGEYSKWKDMRSGGRLQVKITVYESKGDDRTFYIVSDSLDRVAAPMINDKKEVMDWLKDHGYKTTKQWYLEDCGMDESTWNYWNGLEER